MNSRESNGAQGSNSEFRLLLKFLLFPIDGLFFRCQIIHYECDFKTDAVWFTTKGQIVIPAWLRKRFQIEDGIKAMVEATPNGILLKPVTAVTIRRLRGILRRKPDDKPFAEEWAEHKREEMKLEEAKHARYLRFSIVTPC